MAKLSDLSAITNLADTDTVPLVDVSDTTQASSGSARKTLLSTLRSWLGKDEDDMVSDSATHFPTQQSTKAYVDAATSQLAPAVEVTEDLSGSLSNSWSATRCRVRRSGNLVNFTAAVLNGSAATDVELLTVPSGYRPVDSDAARLLVLDLTGFEFYRSFMTGNDLSITTVPGSSTDIANLTNGYVTGSWITADAVPS